MHQNGDYYQVLGVHSSATDDQIKEAYLYKVNILHPDRLAAMPEKVRLQAERDLKEVNRAYAVLSNPGTRSRYDIEVSVGLPDSGPANKPVPDIHPPVIVIEDGLPFVKQKGTFFVRNVGGPFSRVLISPTPGWLKVLETRPVQPGQALPMQVDIEAVGTRWDETYTAMISVYLDTVEAKVTVELRMRQRPA